MFRRLSAAFALPALCSAAAAAGLPVPRGPRPAVVVPAPLFTWTGFDAGVDDEF